ncbi:MAG: DUF1365 family protein, partial [Sedimentisphaerales bacterium]|nr:DUF1365 family protein [Sedimentisphaerales bacterium]
MNSQIFTGKLFHRRSWPTEHQFSYPAYFFRFDLDELPDLSRTLPGFGYNRFSAVRIDDKDYFWRGNEPLKEKIAVILHKIGYSGSLRRIELVGFAKYFNLTFRPVTFFICYDQTDSCALLLAEVHNTFSETHLYVLQYPNQQSGSLCFEVPKAFHVSPFFDRQGTYTVRLKDSTDSMEITIALTKPECGSKPVFFARLSGQAAPLTAQSLRGTIRKYPFNCFMIMPRIIRQAFTLSVRKKLPIYPKPIPDQDFTMRKKSPSWIARQGMKTLFSFLDKHSAEKISVTLPEGQRRLFGKGQTEDCADLQVRDYRFFAMLAKAGEIGFGMAYERGYWRSDNLVQVLNIMLNATLANSVRIPWYSRFIRLVFLAIHLHNRNTQNHAKKNISRHYDLSNAMYQTFLDETLTYSCAIFEQENEKLEEAQLRKMDRILQKACISKHHHILEIGTGWGTLAIRAATRFGCRVTSITLSKEQQQLAEKRIADAGLSDQVKVLLCDYRDVTGLYDRIISVEMLEAVGKAYYPAFFRCCDRLLKPNGIMVIQTITIPDQRYQAYSKTTDWMRLFIFPGGLLPSLTILAEILTRHTSFVVKHVESIGPHYALTLARWKERFLENQNKIMDMGFSERFIRRWEYYFSYCQAGFA